MKEETNISCPLYGGQIVIFEGFGTCTQCRATNKPIKLPQDK